MCKACGKGKTQIQAQMVQALSVIQQANENEILIEYKGVRGRLELIGDSNRKYVFTANKRVQPVNKTDLDFFMRINRKSVQFVLVEFREVLKEAVLETEIVVEQPKEVVEKQPKTERDTKQVVEEIENQKEQELERDLVNGEEEKEKQEEVEEQVDKKSRKKKNV